MHFAFSPPSLDVLAGEVGTARLRIEAPAPAAGQEVSRSFSVLVTSPGIRPFVRGIVERFRAQTTVLSQSEIHTRVRLKTVGAI